MNRRDALCRMAAAAGALAPLPGLSQTAGAGPGPDARFLGPTNPLAAPWAAWKAAFLTPDGRVVDTLQQESSHSESQGYGLLLAALFGDDAAFDAIRAWTEANLAARPDALLAWRWLPAGGAGGVPDRNNASDGDLFYAWGLVMRGRRDGDRGMIDRAGAIARDLVAACLRPAPDGSGRLVLMPAAHGFETEGRLVINPSYYMPRAMREVAAATGAGALAACAADGEALIADLARGGLVPDWVELRADGMALPEGRADHNGYEAMRVPLFLGWSGNTGHPAVHRQALAYRQADTPGRRAAGEHVTVFDRSTGAVLETSPHVGYGAVAALIRCAATPAAGAPIPFYSTRNQAYYPATLHLMALIAQISAAPECTPI